MPDPEWAGHMLKEAVTQAENGPGLPSQGLPLAVVQAGGQAGLLTLTGGQGLPGGHQSVSDLLSKLNQNTWNIILQCIHSKDTHSTHLTWTSWGVQLV